MDIVSMSDQAHQMELLISAVATMTDKMSSMSNQLDSVEAKVDETKEIVEAWEAMKVGGRFVKWLAGLGSGLAGIWLMAKAIGANFFK